MPKRPGLAYLVPTCLLLLSGPGHAQPAPLPPPLVQSRADCAQPQYASDTLVCRDAVLAADDAAVSTLAATPPALAPGAIWEAQDAWFRRRARCAFAPRHRACLVAAYADRRAVLTAATTPAAMPFHCTGPWQGRTVTANSATPGQPVVFRDADLLLAIATPARAGWQPALTWRAAGRGVRLLPRDGQPFACRPGRP